MRLYFDLISRSKLLVVPQTSNRLCYTSSILCGHHKQQCYVILPASSFAARTFSDLRLGGMNQPMSCGSLKYGNNRRVFIRTNTTNILQEDKDDDEEKQSNRAAFKATPIIPSILAYIEKVGVGMRPKRKKHNKRKRLLRGAKKVDGKRQSKSNGDTLDEIEELDYFAENELKHRVQRHNNDQHDNKSRVSQSFKKSVTTTNNTDISEGIRGAYWLPPPPFSSSIKGSSSDDHDAIKNDSLHGKKIIRRPVKLLGKAGSRNDTLPRDSKGLAEVAIAGRSNVGKSTLLNALLYGNTDESLSPYKYKRGGTPERAKLPRGVKAITSSKPGQTKELTFYQLTADVVSDKNDSTSDKDTHQQNDVAKMSLLLVDLPGYGFAFAKEERTLEWKELMHHYLLERKSLKRILLLLDARHGFKKTDFDFLGDLQDGLMTKNVDGSDSGKKVCGYDELVHYLYALHYLGCNMYEYSFCDMLSSLLFYSTEGKARTTPDTTSPNQM